MMEATRTQVSVLGTLAEFHEGAIALDLQGLLDLVVAMHPDLLCLDIPPAQWKERWFDDLPMEYREALLPLAESTDIVVVPIGGDNQIEPASAPGWRGALIQWLRARLMDLQGRAPSPAAANYGWRHDLANVIYELIAMLAEGDLLRDRTEHIQHLIERIHAAARRDPGSRILAVVNVQYCHHIRPALRKDPAIDLIPFKDMGDQDEFGAG